MRQAKNACLHIRLKIHELGILRMLCKTRDSLPGHRIRLKKRELGNWEVLTEHEIYRSGESVVENW